MLSHSGTLCIEATHRRGPFYFFCGFCRSGDHHFQNFFNFNPFIASQYGRLSPKAFGSAAASWQFRRFAFSCSERIKLVPEPRIFTLKSAQALSGAPHFQAQNGSKFGVNPPPPPPWPNPGAIDSEIAVLKLPVRNI